MEEALKKWQELETQLHECELDEIKVLNECKRAHDKITHEITLIKKHIEELMASTGEYEVDIPGEINDYRIGYTTPRDKLDILDEKAVPKKFIEVKEDRRVMRKELLDHLRALKATDTPLPNWASIGQTERNLYWKAVKKKST